MTASPSPPAPPSCLAILWEDAHLLVVNKPGGLLTQPRGRGADEPSLEDSVREYLAPDRPREVYLGTVHRLDRPVSGVLIWAKNVRAARRLASQFEARTVEKTYSAAVEGTDLPKGPAEVEWVDWLGATGPTGVALITAEETPETRRAVTRVSRMIGGRWPEGVGGLWMHPLTGRTHQLRAQSAQRGCPIVGDSAYGSTRPFPGGGIALHARTLSIHHPVLDRRMTFEAPWPSAWGEAGLLPGLRRT